MPRVQGVSKVALEIFAPLFSLECVYCSISLALSILLVSDESRGNKVRLQANIGQRELTIRYTVTAAQRISQEKDERTPPPYGAYGTFELLGQLRKVEHCLHSTTDAFERRLRPLLPDDLPMDLDKFGVRFPTRAGLVAELSRGRRPETLQSPPVVL